MKSSPSESLHYEALKSRLIELDEVLARDWKADERRWLEAVEATARVLFSILEQHQNVSETEGGLLVSATDLKPGLIPESERVKDEHAEMLRRASDLQSMAALQIVSDDFDAEAVCLEMTILRTILQAHLGRVDTLMYDAYFRVEGGEGG
ncbi:MAG: hypothetical protein FIB00_07030 [Chloroflexi bacterium]|nr:hypothetical protein [Chloroflexota bacterium]PWB69356.1 MAG: hypothetical protein C3F15_15515 [Holophagae bacterium]